VGLDDFLVAHGNNGSGELRELLDNASDPQDVTGEPLKHPAKSADPATEARKILDAVKIDNVPRLRYHCGEFLYWAAGRYRPMPDSDVRAAIVQHLNPWFTHVGTSVVNNILEQVKAQAISLL
jgi:hypothetical protein